MRRRRRKELSLNKLIILFIVCTLTFSVGYSLLSQQLSVEGTANLLYEKETTCKEYVTDELKINYDNKMLWHNAGLNYMQIDITLTNLTQEDISDWKVMIKFISDIQISGSWAGNYELVDRKVTITGLDWNKTLAAGGQATFGFQVSTPDEEIKLSSIYLNGDLAIPSESCSTSSDNTGGDNNEGDNTEGDNTEGDNTEGDNTEGDNTEGDNTEGDISDTDINSSNVNVKIANSTSWGSEGNYTYQYDFSVTNNSDVNLDTWSFQFKIPEGAKITNYWNCNYVNADGVVTITPTTNNAKLDVGQSTQIGFHMESPTNTYTLSLR